jgi:hypothetical protein
LAEFMKSTTDGYFSSSSEDRTVVVTWFV